MNEGERSKKPNPVLAIRCPRCDGALSIIGIGYYCPSGHSFTADTLLSEKTPDLKKELQKALQVLERKSLILDDMVNQAVRDGDPQLEATLRRDREAVEKRIEFVRITLARRRT